MEVSFLELKAKQVINSVDGKCLGHITDVIFDVVTAKALGFIVPQPNQGFWGMFKGGKDIFIPFDCVCKLGVDVIIVELYVDNNHEKHNGKRDNCGKNPKDCGKDRCITLNKGYEEIK